MKVTTRIILLVATMTSLCLSLQAKPKSKAPAYRRIDEMKELFCIDRLPSYRSGIVEQISSYDTTGGNNDGFDGIYSYIRKEGDKLVLADLEGPGVIDRIWTPTPTTDTLEFYFDGAKVPGLRICFMDLFSGKVSPFLYPVCANEVGGYYCYFPITYKKSCKVVFCGPKIQFHQIQHRSLAGYDVETFKPELSSEEEALLKETCTKWADINPQASAYCSGKSANCSVKEETFTLAPGEEYCFFQSSKGGRIAGFEIDGGSAFEGVYKDIVLTAKWDDDSLYAINAPLADYFGYAYGKPAMRGMLIGSALGRNYSYLPAPYDKSAKMTLRYELRDDAKQSPVQISTKVFSNDNARDAVSEGRLYTNWRREIRPKDGEHYQFLSHEGRGHYVGTVHLAQGLKAQMTEFFEGDDSTYIDGAMRMHGTGSEDFYNGGWYALLDRWDRGASMPLHGCLDYSLPMSRTGGYRFYLSDKMSFEKEIYVGIEHGPTGNTFPVDYTSVAYFYSDSPAAEQMSPDKDLREVYLPNVHPFFPQSMLLTMGNNVRTSFIYSGIICRSDDLGLVRVMLSEVPEGHYKVYLDYCEKPEGAEFSVWQRQKMIHPWMSCKAEKYNWVRKMYVGEIDITSQNNAISFQMHGEKYTTEFEFANIYLERVD